ncbi:MAG: M20/M25/M40 family metallo-hydrolase [Lentisphaeria bacterium]|nr:M20/M25/M40 family metallo-hydrolase [Lentisphaeria bacterium]
MQEYLKLLEDLIRLRPVSEDVQAVNRATDLLHNYLSGHGLHCTVEELEGRKILYASNVSDKNPDLLLNAHIDVVPAAYESQYEPEYRDGRIYARGAGDCLGNAVCIVKILCEAEPDMSIGAIFTTNEETGGETTGRMVELGYNAKHAIVVMDHWNNYSICCAQKGILIAKLTAHGKGGHSSEPWAFDNPIDKLMDGYLRFRSTWKNPPKDDQWHSTMAATVISGGMVGNQIPDTAEMLLNFRYIRPGENEEIMQKLREVTGLEVTLDRICPPVTVSEDAPVLKILADTVEEIAGVRPGFDRMNGATDARWFASLKTPIAIMGIESDGAHAKVEYARVDSIELFSRIIKSLSRKLSAQK